MSAVSSPSPSPSPSLPQPDASASTARAARLAASAESLTARGDHAGAARALREASALAPDDAAVRRALEALREAEHRPPPLVPLVKRWLASRDEADAKAAARVAAAGGGAGGITDEAAADAMELLLEYDEEADEADELTGALLSRHRGARRRVAEAVGAEPTTTFNKLFVRGDDSCAGLIGALLEPAGAGATAVWASEDARTAAQRDAFQLALAKMMEAGQDHPERAMRAVARLLAVEAAHLHGLIDADGFDAILESLDLQLPRSLRSQATLATAKLLELSPETAQALIAQFVTSRVVRPTTQSLVAAFSAAAAVFPLVPAVAANLFLYEGFIEGLGDMIKDRKSHRLEQASLNLLSAACIDKPCREAIRKHCRPWLREMVEKEDGRTASSAALILIKAESGGESGGGGGGGTSPKQQQQQQPHDGGQDELVALFKKMVIGPPDKSGANGRQDSIEGLAYASLKPRVKESLASDSSFLKSLMQIMGQPSVDPQVMYGGLNILSNLTAYRPPLAEEQKKMAQLKAYANANAGGKSAAAEPDPLDADDRVTARCRKVLDAGVVPVMAAYHKRGPSPSTQALMLDILLSLSKEQKHRGLLAQQGAVKMLLQIQDAISKTAKDQASSTSSPASSSTVFPAAASFTAAHALARILISVNPSHVFSSSAAALPITSAIRALLPLLDTSHDNPILAPASDSTGSRTLLPTFEALLALTNLASLPDPHAHDLLASRAWPLLDSLLLSSNTLVQRAAAELACNLAGSHAGARAFGALLPNEPKITSAEDGAPPPPTPQLLATRTHVLLALTDAEDAPTRKAAGGALAMLSAYPAVVAAVLARERGIALLLGLCAAGSGGEEGQGERSGGGAATAGELRHRGVVAVKNVVGAPGEIGRAAREKTRGLRKCACYGSWRGF
ncbi:myosin-binding striated muscle assembly central-domain-containing protein [Lineolata rhizophorae]|uniref:Myosin-binding striated muscle assembly central-domain-containing protein n=1 Tax=Lineolata rhizophorae TaxID=578093 RepID=A0A6A6PB02_9PEZI|nr:myosin-binding striated muscle assembly central-domain-containing protein [Lineolata rhizophorae]